MNISASFVLLFIGCFFGINIAAAKEYCWETFNATCPVDEVIMIQTAHYGRMKFGRCLTRDYYVGCVANILPQMERRCSGRRACTLDVPDNDLHKMQPCPKDLMAYLDLTYICVKVAGSDNTGCNTRRFRELPQTNTGSTGYISNFVTDSSSSSSSCPWLITVSMGQRINITLIDFASFGSSSGRTGSHVCLMYAVVKEVIGESSTDVSVCGGDKREKAVYLSEGNRLSVEIMNTNQLQERPYFLLKYEAVGCGDLKAPLGGWLLRQGDRATVSCNHTADVWHLVCSGDVWVGGFHNCSSVPGVTSEIDGSKLVLHPFPFGLFMAVIVGIALGVFVGVFMLSAVVCCRKDRHIRSRKYSSKTPVVVNQWQQSARMDNDAGSDVELEKCQNILLSDNKCCDYDRTGVVCCDVVSHQVMTGSSYVAGNTFRSVDVCTCTNTSHHQLAISPNKDRFDNIPYTHVSSGYQSASNAEVYNGESASEINPPTSFVMRLAPSPLRRQQISLLFDKGRLRCSPRATGAAAVDVVVSHGSPNEP